MKTLEECKDEAAKSITGVATWLEFLESQFWHRFQHRLGIVNKNTTPVDTGLDPDGWLPYFMEGLRPSQAVQQDLNEQA